MWQTTAAAEPVLAGQGQRAERTALVLTALPEEYVAVRQRLAEGEELRGRGGARYLEATLSGVSIRWTVYVFEVGMGNASAASVIGTAVEEFRADLVLFVGIAAGTKPDDQRAWRRGHRGPCVQRSRGQVRYRPGRAVNVPVPAEGPGYRLPPGATREAARANARTRPRAEGRKPRITVGSIASTEAVIADQGSQIFRHITDELNDCVAIDMETFGAYEAAHASRVLVVAVRGMSDFVAGKTAAADARWQPIAARNAADVAADLLAMLTPTTSPRS